MTTKEFSDTFDVLISGYSIPSLFSYSPSIGNLVFDEYEKSVYLTLAQELIVVELYTGRNNKGASFELTEELRSSLRELIKTVKCEQTTDSKGLSKESKFFVLPPDLLFITYEEATIDDNNANCKNGKSIHIIPVSLDEFHNVINNPFRGLSSRRAIRLDNNSNIVEIISKYNIKDYTIRYLSKPTPIILEDLGDNLKIDGEYKITQCKLDSAIHRTILERAVALALASRGSQSNK